MAGHALRKQRPQTDTSNLESERKKKVMGKSKSKQHKAMRQCEEARGQCKQCLFQLSEAPDFGSAEGTCSDLF